MPTDIPAIPDHELLRLIGRGSYGEVWMARNTFGTLRAVKVVRRSTFDSDRPFTRELSGIQRYEPISRAHEGLVDILQVGRNEAEQFFYYVMELADDANTGFPVAMDMESIAGYRPRMLSSTVGGQEPMTPHRAIPFFLTLAEGVGYLHGGGLLHRDIKSANVIFVNGVPKLADLGLVVEAGESRTFVGTEGFIPPEGPGTMTADIYALGKLMYEVATGRDRMEFPSLPLNRISPEKNRDLLELNAILLRCCAPDPRDRYLSTAELQADLAILRSGQSVQELRSFQRRLKLTRRLGAFAALVAAVLMGVMFLVRRQAKLARDDFNRSEILRVRSEMAERSAKEQLFAALMAQGAAERRSGRAGARQKALEALTVAAGLHPATPELRSEAISALALSDVSVVRKILGPTNSTSFVAISPDGRIFTQGIEGGDTVVGATRDGTILRVLHDSGGVAGPFSGDGHLLMTAPEVGIQKIWDMDRGVAVASVAEGEPRLFCFGPTSNQFMVRSGKELIIRSIYDDSTQTVHMPDLISRYQLSTEGGLLAWTGGGNSSVHVTKIPEGTPLAVLNLDPDVEAINLAWSPDQTTLAIGTTSHRVLLWQPGSTNRPAELSGHGAEVVSLTWSPSGHLLISGSWDNTTRIWDVAEKREMSRLLVTSWHNAFLPDERQIVLYTSANSEFLWCDIHSEEVCRFLREPGADAAKSPYQCVFSADSSLLFEGCHDGFRVFRASTGKQVGFLAGNHIQRLVEIPGNPREFVAVDRTQRGILSWSENPSGQVTLDEFKVMDRFGLARHDVLGRPWVGGSGRGLALYFADGRLQPLPGSENAIISVTSRDGHWVLASFGGRAAYWDISGADPTYTCHDLGPARTFGIAISHDSRRLYFATVHDLCCIEAVTGRLLWRTRLTENSNFNADIAESNDGTMVAAGIPPYAVSLVDAATGRWLANLEHPDSQPINYVAFSPDGHWFAVACTSHVTQLWDLRELRSRLKAMNADW